MLEFTLVADAPSAKIPWLLVAANVLLLALLLYVIFVGWLPAKHQVSRLESELKDVYAREAALQTRLAQQEQRGALREQQLNTLRGERDTLARRIEELERELTTARTRRK